MWTREGLSAPFLVALDDGGDEGVVSEVLISYAY